MAMRGDEVMERSPALARSTETCKDSEILQQFQLKRSYPIQNCDCGSGLFQKFVA